MSGRHEPVYTPGPARHRGDPLPGSIDALARRLGVTPERLRDFLGGRRDPAPWVRRVIAEWREAGGDG